LIKLHDEFKESGFVILAIDLREKRKIVKKFVEKQKMPFPVLLDKDGKVSNRYGIRGVPAYFIINRQGEIIGMAKGAKGWESVESRNLIRFLVDKNHLR
jgi:peroxiredoxin